MITVRLKGGMGNQMFQYAFARALAVRNNDKVVLDLAPLLDRTPRSNFVFRNYDLDIFNIEARLTFFSRAALRFPIPVLWAGASVIVTFIKKIFGIQRFVRESLDFDLAAVPRTGNLYLDGAWQSEAYFISIAPLIRREFTFRGRFSPRTRELEAQIRMNDGSICVNVRRGDFVTLERSIKEHGFVGVEYYAQAMKVVAQEIREPHVYVFSDEVEWCRENLQFPDMPVTYVGHEYAGKKFGEYLHLMVTCTHFIIPNSSFAWWAAWLAESPKKNVVAPKRWFASGAGDQGVVPLEWRRI
jgi:hypothetical protein